jgi:hypothetical protein
MRTPRARPDLKLAESYVPAAITFAKGLLYTCALCMLWRLNVNNIQWAQLIMLYYDHLLWPSGTFIDSTSLCTDVVGGTLFMILFVGGTTPLVWGGVIGWAVLGAGHVVMPFVINHMLVHMAVPVAALTCVLLSPPQPSAPPLLLWPYMLRSALFLLLSIIDSYALRPPTQRERDRVCLMRYGATLFAPMVPCLLVCAGLLVAAQATRIYQQAISNMDDFNHTTTTSTPTIIKTPAGLRNLEEGKQRAVKMAPAILSNDVNSLDVNEAFRLAKLQYMENRSI